MEGSGSPSETGALPGLDDFTRVVGSPFALQDEPAGAGVRDLTIDEVEEFPGSEGRSFSAFFSAPGPNVLPQRIYHLRHRELGELALFLVPIGIEPDPPGPGAGAGTGSIVRYQAVFNRLPDATP